MVTINIGRKEAIFFGAIILVFLIVGLGVAYDWNDPSATQGSDASIHGHTSNEVDGLVSGGSNLECVSIQKVRNGAMSFIGSTSGVVYDVSELAVGTNPLKVTIKSPWVLTGCVVATDGTDEDAAFEGGNACFGGTNNEDTVYVRACKGGGGLDGRYIPSDIKVTTNAHNGQFATSGIGYDELQSWIESNGCSGYHVCNIDEIVGYMSKTGNEIGEGWIQGAGSREWHRSGALFLDCASWTSKSGAADYSPRGGYWDSTSKGVNIGACNLEKPVLCCK